MKIKNFEVSAADLNTHAVNEIDTVLTITQNGYSGISQAIDYFPKKIQFINKTSVDVKVNIISNQKELEDYTADPTNYQLFTVLNNTSVVLTSQQILPAAWKMLVQAPAGVATAAFVIECIGYQPRI